MFWLKKKQYTKSKMMDYIRWQQLMIKFELPENESTFHDLVRLYGEKHRFYHNSHHIDAVLNHLDKISELVERPHEIELALWFHDAIYKPFSSTNELDSANMCKAFLASNGVSSEATTHVYNLIMATLHTTTVNSIDEKFIVDIDLSILGAKPCIYEQFEKNVRKEYRLVPYFLYKKKRIEILQSFLSRENIYHSKYFENGYGEQAKNNIASAITTL